MKKFLTLLFAVLCGLCVLTAFVACTSYNLPLPEEIVYGISEDTRPSAGDVSREVSPMLYKNTEGDVLPFLMTKPVAEEEGKTYPLVIFLHGRGDGGTDNRNQFKWNAELYDGLKNHDCFAFYPQAPYESRWGYAENEYSSVVDGLTELALTKYAIDANRIYILGFSMGGYGTASMVARHPERYAAAVVLSGGTDGDRYDYSAWKNVPAWIAHGTADDVVDPEESKKLTAGIENAGGTVRLELLDGKKHVICEFVFSNPTFFEWLFSQSKA